MHFSPRGHHALELEITEHFYNPRRSTSLCFKKWPPFRADEMHLGVNRCQLLLRHYLLTHDPGARLNPTVENPGDTRHSPKRRGSRLERRALLPPDLMKHLLQIALHVSFLYINTADSGFACQEQPPAGVDCSLYQIVLLTARKWSFSLE